MVWSNSGARSVYLSLVSFCFLRQHHCEVLGWSSLVSCHAQSAVVKADAQHHAQHEWSVRLQHCQGREEWQVTHSTVVLLCVRCMLMCTCVFTPVYVPIEVRGGRCILLYHFFFLIPLSQGLTKKPRADCFS